MKAKGMTMRILLFGALAALAVPAHADIRAVYEERQEKRILVFEIAENGNFRAGAPGSGGYRLVIDGKAYQVAEVDGRIHVARLDDIHEALKATTPGIARNAMKAVTFLGTPPQQIVRRGWKSVNGWKGREYRVEDPTQGLLEEDYITFDDAASYVVSADPRLSPAGNAIARFTADELAFKRHMLSGRATAMMLGTLGAIARRGTIISSSEGDVRLIEANEAAIDTDRLALPGPVMERSELIAMMEANRNPFARAAR
jgi:hypothetical protein